MATTAKKESFLPPLWLLSTAALLLLLWLIVELKEIVVLLVVGYSVAFVVDPILDRFEARGVSRSAGVIIIFIVILIVITLLALTAIPTLVNEYIQLQKGLPTYVVELKGKVLPFIARVKSHLPDVISDSINEEVVLGVLPQAGGKALSAVLAGLKSSLLKGYSITLTIINLLLLPFIVFYLCVDFDRFHQTVLYMLPERFREKTSSICAEMDHYVSAFVVGQLTVGGILFLLYAAGLGIVGVELWFLLALISGFGNMVPYLGFAVGIVLSSVMALLTFGDFTHLLYVWMVFAVVQALEGSVITPKIMGDKVGISPLAVILFLFAGGKLFGLLGVFLAVPAAAVLRVLGRHTRQWVVEKIETEDV